MTKKQQPANIQFSFRYNGERGDKLIGYAYATRRKTTDVLRDALDFYYEHHKDTIDRRQV